MTLKPGKTQLEAHLVDIGKEIVRKCFNVPLALRVVGSLLQGQSERMWQYLSSTDLTSIKQAKNGILPVLKISYYYLPSHLKRCFSYCAIFTKDYRIWKEDLVCLWMAQGFITPKAKSYEDLGNEYFMNLLQRCFFQDIQRDESGEIMSCKMHDLIHDIAKEVAGTEIYSVSCFNQKTRHVFFDSTDTVENVTIYTTKMKRIRTFWWLYTFSANPFKLLPKLRYLRVLNFDKTLVKKLPNMIGELIHLRYLNLSNNYKLCVLPTTITLLYNLQTLRLHGCTGLKELPTDLSKLVNLRHLDLSQCTSLIAMPRMHRMTCLQKLTRFVVGDGTKYASISEPADGGGLGDLKYLNNLTGNMEIMVRRGGKYEVSEVMQGGYLINKPHLREISISWNWEPYCYDNTYGREDDSEVTSNKAEALLQGLQPHHKLRMFGLFHYPGVRFPTWLISSMNLETCLPNLVEIKLSDCMKLEHLHLPLMSQLRHLKVLQLEKLRKLEYVENSSSGRGGGGVKVKVEDELVFFPSLEQLVLCDLPVLKGWWNSLSYSKEVETKMEMQSYSYSFPRLSNLRIWECPSLTAFPNCPRLEILMLRNFNTALCPILRLNSDASSSSDCEKPSNDFLSTSMSNSLRIVRIDNMGYLNTLHVLSFKNLSQLTVSGDHDMETLSTNEAGEILRSGCLSSLRSLSIRACRKLKRLSEEGVWNHLTALESLSLSDLEELVLEDANVNISSITSFSCREREVQEERKEGNEGAEADILWTYLGPSLCSLNLIKLPKLVKLPKGMRHLTSLQSHKIRYCDNFESLTAVIGHLSSLQSIDIQGCSRLKSLPEEMRHLTSLSQLVLQECCLELKERCENPTGADWHKIKHIPNFHIQCQAKPQVSRNCFGRFSTY